MTQLRYDIWERNNETGVSALIASRPTKEDAERYRVNRERELCLLGMYTVFSLYIEEVKVFLDDDRRR